MNQVFKIIERYDRPFEYFGVLLKALLIVQFLSLWIAPPKPDDVERIANLATLMAFEFIMVHSGVFMAVFPKKFSLFIFIPIYGLFALAFNSFMDDHVILVLYLVVVFNRMRFAFADVPKWMRSRAIMMSLASAFLYLILVFVSLLIPWPALGLDAEFLEAVRFRESVDFTGSFVEQPHQAMVFGALYYGALLWIELLLLKKNKVHYNTIPTK